MTFGKLILRKIIKIVATRCHILKINAPNSVSAGALPQTMLGKYTALPAPTHLAGFKGPTSRGKDGRGREVQERRDG